MWLKQISVLSQYTNGLLPITSGRTRILFLAFFLKEMKVCIVSFFVWSFVFEDSSKYLLFSETKKEVFEELALIHITMSTI